MELRERALQVDRVRPHRNGPGEHFHGWGVMGLPFDSGHVLALRRFPVSSVGPGYTAIWHRSPRGAWTMYVDVPPRFACPRYFSRDVARVIETEIVISWAGPRRFRVVTGRAGFHWDVGVRSTPATRIMTGAAQLVPERAWRSDRALALLGGVAGPMLRAGTLRLHGHAPNGQRFRANPRRVWAVAESSAVVDGEDPGTPGPLDRQARLEDFWIPQRGLVAMGSSVFEAKTGTAPVGGPPTRTASAD